MNRAIVSSLAERQARERDAWTRYQLQKESGITISAFGKRGRSMSRGMLTKFFWRV
jgi:hypothetical protein